MNILVTGAAGFVGKNLCEALKAVRDGKDRTRPELKIDEIFEYDIASAPASLDGFCEKADFVFNLAGVNRPKDHSEFMAGNFGFASELLASLEKAKNACPVMLSSSVQATLIGRYGQSDTASPNSRAKNCFLTMQKKRVQKCLFIAFRISSENGADRITIPPLRRSATILQTICP